MNDMQMNMLNELNKADLTEYSTARKTRTKDKTGSEFHSLMTQEERKTALQDTKQSDEADKAAADHAQPLDIYTIQELAAMQMLHAETTQIVVGQEAEAVQPVQREVLLAPPSDTEPVMTQVPGPRPEPEGQGAETAQDMGQRMDHSVDRAAPGPQEMLPQENELEDGAGKPDRARQGPAVQAAAKHTEKELTEHASVSTESKVFSQVQTVPIKVSEAAEEPARPQGLGEQVSYGLKEALTRGEAKVEIQLMPEHLGKITIELTKREDGTLQVVMQAEHSRTRAILEHDLPSIQNVLSRSSQQEVLVQVHSQQETQQKEFYDGHRQQDRQQQEEHHHEKKNGDDFLDRLRLGLVPEEEAVV